MEYQVNNVQHSDLDYRSNERTDYQNYFNNHIKGEDSKPKSIKCFTLCVEIDRKIYIAVILDLHANCINWRKNRQIALLF
jgi:hypothetical protein